MGKIGYIAVGLCRKISIVKNKVMRSAYEKKITTGING
jgi:hypothetical protein